MDLHHPIPLESRAPESGHPAAGIGFGCGTEPLIPLLAKFNVSLLATDLTSESELAKTWRQTGQNTGNLEQLFNPHLVSRADFEARIRYRDMDMTNLPLEELAGNYDFAWSSCALEHLGSKQKESISFSTPAAASNLEESRFTPRSTITPALARTTIGQLFCTHNLIFANSRISWQQVTWSYWHYHSSNQAISSMATSTSLHIRSPLILTIHSFRKMAHQVSHLFPRSISPSMDSWLRPMP
jgi:hypothetical protein